MEKENGTTTITELAEKIAAHLGGWELKPPEGPEFQGTPILAYLVHESGAKIGFKTVGISSHVVTQNHRVEVFPCWPPGPPNSGWQVYSPHDPDAWMITAAVRRGPKAIAGDVARRMPLSAFLVEYAKEAERSKRDADRMKRNKAFIEDIACFWDTNPYPGGLRVRRHDIGSSETLDMEIQWNRAKLTIESEDLDTIAILARLMTMSGADLLDVLTAAKVTLDNLHDGDFDLCPTLDLLDSMSREEAGRLRIIVGEALK